VVKFLFGNISSNEAWESGGESDGGNKLHGDFISGTFFDVMMNLLFW
jgi:hypothetical protein